MPMRSARRLSRQVVYLLHFATPYQHARHYVGWSEQLEARLAHHREGRGARLMAAVSEAGIDFTVARLWQGADRAFERRLHNAGGKARLCPICSGEAALRRAQYASETHKPARTRMTPCPF